MRRMICTIATALLLTISSTTWAQVPLPNGKTIDPVDYMEDLWNLTTDKFYDAQVLEKKGWLDIGERYLAQAVDIDGQEELHDLANKMLAELKTSHLVVVHGTVYRDHLQVEFQNRKAPLLGMEIAEIDGKYFVASTLEHGPATKAGLKVGDQVLRIDGLPVKDAEGLYPAGHDPGLPGAPGFVLTVKDGQKVAFVVRNQKAGPTREVTVTAKMYNMIQAVKDSIRVVEKDGKKIGVIHLWHFIHMNVARYLQSALQKQFKDCDAIVLDVRGRGGSTLVINAIMRLVKSELRNKPERPFVALTDNHTRSAKEIFSYLWQRENYGPVVGETTQGACIGTTFHRLRDGSYALMPQVGVTRLTDGVEIEGRGVAPTIVQKQLPVPFRNGRDAILERGLKVALEQLGTKKANRKSRGKARLY